MQQTVVLIGGGHTHALLIKKITRSDVKQVRWILIDQNSKAPYTGMLPDYTAGHYINKELYIDLKSLSKSADIEFIHKKVINISSATKRIKLEGDQTIDYDIASIDIGIHARDDSTPGMTEYSVPVKPLTNFVKAWEKIKDYKKEQLHLVVIGGGIAATEMMLTMRHALKEKNPKCTIVSRSQFLDGSSMLTRYFLNNEIRKKNITILDHSPVQRVHEDHIELKDGTKLASDLTVSAIGAKPYSWLRTTDLKLEEGYIVVNKYLQIPKNPCVFAVGDCAHFLPRPLPKAGVYAVRQAPVLHTNIMAMISNAALHRFKPQKRYLKIISLGEKKACADKYGLAIKGILPWWVKHFINKKFMNHFQTK